MVAGVYLSLRGARFLACARNKLRNIRRLPRGVYPERDEILLPINRDQNDRKRRARNDTESRDRPSEPALSGAKGLSASQAV